VLTGDQMSGSAPRKWLLMKREAGIPGEDGGAERWSADHLFVDQSGIPTIVEVKRSTDTRIRREVVGQMLDYAANVVAHWPTAHIQARFIANCGENGIDPDDRLRDFLDEDVEPDEFWSKAEQNLQDRNVRLLFVADVIPPELQRIIEFLNDQM